MKLSEASKVINADLLGSDETFYSVCIDSRDIQPGALFIAVIGDSFDGHKFVEEAARKGAVAAIVSDTVSRNLSCLKVQDTRAALSALACYHRNQMKTKVIGVTGSCGKTTVKTLLASILSKHGNTLSNAHSFNNDIGVPLTLLRLKPDHEYTICEIGANHQGEISQLTHFLNPDIAIITNAAAAHLEGFGNIDGVACAKGEIFQGLSPKGTAIVNADDRYADFWKKLIGEHQIITFGRYHAADVMAKSINFDDSARTEFDCLFPTGAVHIIFPFLGEHNVMNAIAAAAAAYSLSVPLEKIQKGLTTVEVPQNRLFAKLGYAGATVIDDSCNANPLSVAAAMSVLSKRGGNSIFVLGDMLELGEHTDDMHRQMGKHAQKLGIQSLYCFGKHSRYAAEDFGKNAHYFSDKDTLLSALRECLGPDVTVLVKGSRAMKMGEIVEALTKHF